jgi:L-alanine-DL-glutamate epimerase-like enolase superfamily enzyme
VRITRVSAQAISFAVPPAFQVSLGIGRTVKRDAVVVKVETDAGLTGWGEAHAARAPTAIAELINTTLAQLVTGMDALDTEAVWARVYRMQLASHGAGAAAVIGLSGIDMALWDVKGKHAGQPLWQLLGGERRAIASYAGGIALGFEPPAALAEEAAALVARGFGALKLRMGDGVANDCARVEAVRAALGESCTVMVDANTAYDLATVTAVAPCLAANRIAWLEEPFPAHAWRDYQAAARITRVPLAAGENHYTRFDFERIADDGAISIWQPDLSKTGGITEGLRIAALAAQNGVKVHPHTSATGLNMAASLHFLAALDNGGYYEADVTRYNPFRDELCSAVQIFGADGSVLPPGGPGLGVELDLERLAASTVIAGPGYV